MKTATRKLFDQYYAAVAEMNGVSDISKSFSVEPSVEQVLENKIMASSAFLSLINIIGREQMQGEVLRMGDMTPLGKRTVPADLPRQPNSFFDLAPLDYQLVKTDFDYALRYVDLDNWAKFPNFAAMLSNWIVKRMSYDRIRIGWFGQGADLTKSSNLATSPNQEDVNMGWIAKLALQKPSHVLDMAALNDKVGPNSQYKHLHALVWDAKDMMPTWASSDPELVAICGNNLLNSQRFMEINRPLNPAIDGGRSITSDIVRDIAQYADMLGGRPAITVPIFPENDIFITPLRNLSIYYQEGGRRRYVREEPDYNRTVDYQSSNEAYVIEDPNFAVAIKNISFEAGVNEGFQEVDPQL